jgi:hypothetical protein
MKRYLARMEHKGAPDDTTDDMCSFFMHAWHLRDWVCHDQTLCMHPELTDNQRLKQIQMKDVSEIIRLCGNVADHTKHFQFRDQDRMFPAVTRKNIDMTPGSGLPAEGDYLFECPDGSIMNALNFARQVVDELNKFILRYGVTA